MRAHVDTTPRRSHHDNLSATQRFFVRFYIGGIKPFLFAVVVAAIVIALPDRAFSADKKGFQIEEATIHDIHTAIQKGQTTCVQVVKAYLERTKAYNGMCTALVTKDGAPIAPALGRIMAGAPLKYPTETVAVAKVLPHFDQYKGLPIEYGRMETTISDPTVVQQFGMRVGLFDAGQVNALETLNLRGERSVSCKAKCDAHPSAGALPATCPKECDAFRKLPDALERAAELDKKYGAKPDLKALPMYCVNMSIKNWYDAIDMRATVGNDVNFAMDVPKVDHPDVEDLRQKGAIIFAIATASSTGLNGDGPAKPKYYIPNGNFQDAAWAGQACNPYDTSRVPRGTSNGSGVQRPRVAQRRREPIDHEGRHDGRWRRLLRCGRSRRHSLPHGSGRGESARCRKGLRFGRHVHRDSAVSDSEGTLLELRDFRCE
jgi:amidase